MREVEQRYRAAKRAARTYGIEVGRAAVEHKRLTRELKATELAQRELVRRQAAGGRLRRMWSGGLAAAGTVYGAGRVIGGAMDLEERGIHLGNVIGAPDQAAAVGRALQHARTFAGDTLATEGELLDIQYQLGSAGLQEEAARVGTEIVHKLAKITKGTPAEVGKIAATTYNNLASNMEGAVGDKLARIGNVLARTQIRYQIENFGQLGESLSEGAAGAVSAKLPLEQLAAVVGQLNTAGQEGSEAGTALRAVLRSLTTAAGELGTEVVRDAQGQLDLVATLEQVRDATADLDTDARGDLLRKIFGDEGQAGIVPLLKKIDELKAGVDDLRAGGQSDLVNEKYERFLESASGKWTRLTQNVRQAGDAFGGALLPRSVAVLAPAVALAGWLGEAIVKYPMAAEVVGWLGVAFVGAAATLALLTAGTWAYGAAETALSTVLRSRLLSLVAGRAAPLAHATAMGVWTVATKIATAGQWLLNAALTANPIGLVVAGVAALVGGAVPALAELEAGDGLVSGCLGGAEGLRRRRRREARPRGLGNQLRSREPTQSPRPPWSPSAGGRRCGRGRRCSGAAGRRGPCRGGGHRCGHRSRRRDAAGGVRGADADGDRGRGAASAAGASARRVRSAGKPDLRRGRFTSRGARRSRDDPCRRRRRAGDRGRGRAPLRDDAAPRRGRGRAGRGRCLRPSSAGAPAVRPSPEAGGS